MEKGRTTRKASVQEKLDVLRISLDIHGRLIKKDCEVLRDLTENELFVSEELKRIEMLLKADMIDPIVTRNILQKNLETPELIMISYEPIRKIN